MQQYFRRFDYVGLVALVLGLAGCAAMGPGSVGFGSYLQVTNASGKVVMENNASKNGYLNCPNAANIMIQENSSLKGRLVCAHEPTAERLPFSIKVHSINSPSGNETRDTSPFYSRHATRASCTAALASIKADKKWIILENTCPT